MSTNNPPNPNINIFNNAYWASSSDSLTQEAADLRYLRWPVAQGDETLKNITVQGNATITNGSNSLILNSNASATQYNPCVTNGAQVISGNGTVDNETLILTTQSTTNNGIIINNSSVNFSSTNAPTSNQTLLASNDNSNKIPTTAWIQSILSSAGSVYSVRYITNQTVVTPNNCRCIDLVVMGAGGAAGDFFMDPTTFMMYFGGSGSGGNCISANGIPMGSGESLNLTFSLTSTTGSTTVTRNSVILARAFNGNKGTNGSLNTDAAGGTTNTTIGVGDTSFASWYNTFGSPGGTSQINGIDPPDMVVTSVSCPKGNSTWVDGGNGMGEKLQGSGQGGGYVLITYHIGV